jgi:hypothetical protein
MGRIELAPACIYSSPFWEGFSPLLFRGGEEPRSGGGVGFVRQTQHQPDKPHPNPVEGRGAFRVSPRHKVSITKAPLHHASHGPPPRAGEELPPLLFRGGEEPRSGGGVGFVRQTQHQPDKPHPNPVEGRGAFRVSPRHKVRISRP